MKDQFCTYEISLKLKELGFDEECFGMYIDGKFYYMLVGNPYTSGIKKIKAPLWQQAISFLKERKVLVTELWDGWEYGVEDEDFIYCETIEEAILNAIEIYQKNKTITN